MLSLSNSSYHLFGGYIRYIDPFNHLKVEVFASCNRSQLDDLVNRFRYIAECGQSGALDKEDFAEEDVLH